MKDIVNRYIDRFQKNHRHFRRYIIFVGVLAVVTIIGVNWGLHQEGISMTDEYVCGYQEHQHTDDCYQNELICGQEENDEHQHSEECYEKTLICTLPEHTHIDSCKKQVGVSTIAVYTSNSMNDNGNVTAISGNGTKYDENGNIYSLDLRIDFKFSAAAVSSNQSYYYEYPEGIIIPDALLNKTYTLHDSQGKEAGTYSFEKTEDGKYRVKIDFKEGYVTAESDDIIGYIQFAGQIDGNKADDNGNIKIDGDGVTLDIPKDQITYPEDATNRYEIKTKKAGSYSTKDGKLIYTVTVYSLKGTPGDINFEDIISANGLTLSNPKVEVTQETIVRYYNNGNPYDDRTPKESNTLNVNYQYENGKLSMTLPKIDEAKKDENSQDVTYTKYTIKYIYDIENIEGASVVANNKVTTDSKNENVEVKSDSIAEVTINNVHTINKSGWYDSSNGEIEWTITVNKNNLNITGAKLTDDMLSKLAEGADVTISPSIGYTLEKDENDKITGITFIALEDGKNTDTYTIKYKTKADRKWDKETVTNKATFKPSTGDGITSTGTVNVPGGSVNKKYTEATKSKDDKTAKVGWKITVDVPSSLPKGTVIKDDPTQDQYGGSGGKQYLTRQQVIDWANGIYWTDGDGKKVGNLNLIELAEISFKASDGKEYTWDEIKSSNSNDLTFTVWNVKLKENIEVPDGAQKLIFDYKTTADLEDADMGTTYYKNTVTIGDKKDDARYGYEKCGVIKTDENGRKEITTKTNADGTLVWKIKTHINKETGKLTFEDNLPEGIKLVSVAGGDNLRGLTNIIIEDNGTINGTSGSYQVTGTYENNKVTLGVTLSTGKQLSKGDYTFILTCKVNKDIINNYESGKTYTFKNSATVSNDDGKIGSADQSQEWTEDTSHEESKVIDKTGKWDNNSRRVKYSISLNPDGKDIVEDSEILTLKDVFKYYSIVYGRPENAWNSVKYNVSARLIPDSVKLYKGIKKADGTLEKGEEIKSWAWTVEETADESPDWEGGYNRYSTLVGENIPDSTPMILEYDYQIETDIPDGWQSYYPINVNNSASLEGTAYKDDKTQNDTEWKKQESSGAVTTDIRGILYKVSQGNYGQTLPGATFKLQKYNDGQFEDTDITYTTDNDGKITIKYQKLDSDTKYDYNVLYRVVEETAPDGYLKSDNPEENAFYFYFSSDTDTTYTLPSNLNELAPKAADLSKASTTFYVENESCNTELTINKKWFDAQGNVEVGHGGTVRVQLYQRTSKYPPSMGNIAKISGSINIKSVDGNKIKEFTESNYRIGSAVKFTVTCTGDSEENTAQAPTVMLNGTEINPEITPWDGKKIIYTYTFTLNDTDNIITGHTQEWNDESRITISDLEVTESTSEDKLLKEFDITSSDSWSKVISDLPAIGTNDAGERVYYTYYVKELGNSNYDVSYDNNEGINFGTITIKNKMSENPSYVLPETGSFGEVIVALGGLIMMIVAVIYYLKNKKIEGKGRKI